MAEIAGLKLIVPSSVAGSGVSVSASGKVTFTAATSVSVNGVFDSTYDNYLLVIREVHSASTAETANLRLRASGSDASGSNYTVQVLDADGSGVGGIRQTSQTSMRYGVSSTGYGGSHVYLYGPNLAQPTAVRVVNCHGYLGARIVDQACTHSLSTAYDGFTLLPASGNVTGICTVYGLSQ